MVKIIFVPCEFDEEIFLDENSIKSLKEKKINSLFIFSSVQFNTKNIEKQLENIGIKIKKTKAKRTLKKGQILGCDCYSDSFSEDIFNSSSDILYIGDGLFHPFSLLLAQKENFRKNIFVFNPLKKSLTILTIKDIQNIIYKLKRNLRIFLNAKKIGIISSTKYGQNYLESCFSLKKEIEKKGKEVFVFVCDFVDLKELENFSFIDCWINTACPRIGLDDILSTEKPLINLKDALNIYKILDS